MVAYFFMSNYTHGIDIMVENKNHRCTFATIKKADFHYRKPAIIISLEKIYLRTVISLTNIYFSKYLLYSPMNPAQWRASSFAISCTVS